MRKQYENRWYSAEDDHTGLSLVSVESEIEGYIEEENASHIENNQTVKQMLMKLMCCSLTMVVLI